MRCEKCGTYVEPGQIFCGNCGAPIAEQKKDYTTLKLVLIIGGIILVLIAIVVVLMTVIFNKKEEDAYKPPVIENDTTEEVVGNDEVKIVEKGEATEQSYETKIEKISERDDELFAEYPVITATITLDGVKKANAGYQANAKNTQRYWQRTCDELGDYSDQEMYEETVENVYLEENEISVQYHIYEYSGGAHPNGRDYGLSYNLETGEELSIGDLLECSDDIAWETAVQVFNKTIVGAEITEASIRSCIRDSGFWKTTEGVKVHIPAGVVGAYALGAQEALVTSADVQAIESGQTYSPAVTATPIPATPAPTVAVPAVPPVQVPSQATISVINGISANASDFIFPYSSTQLLTASDLSILEASTTEQEHSNSQLAINEMLARYGFSFNPDRSDTAREAYNKFSGLSWYQQAQVYCPYSSANDMIANMNSTEKENIDRINAWQQAHGCYY